MILLDLKTSLMGHHDHKDILIVEKESVWSFIVLYL